MGLHRGACPSRVAPPAGAIGPPMLADAPHAAGGRAGCGQPHITLGCGDAECHPLPLRPSDALKSMARSRRPPEHLTALVWLRNQGHASTLAFLARSYLQPADTRRIEQLLRRGRTGRAVTRFCERFSQRCFPVDYPWTGDADGRLLAEVAGGIQHEGFGDDWEEYGDLWSLRPVFLLSWGLMEDPYAPMRDEFLQDEADGDDRAEYRLSDQAREIIAEFATVPVTEFFASVPVDGFAAGHLRQRLEGTRWEPLLWAAPWLWRLSGNAFLDQSPSEGGEPEPWQQSTVFRLAADSARPCGRCVPSMPSTTGSARHPLSTPGPPFGPHAARRANACRPSSICPWSDATAGARVDGSARTLERRASMPRPPKPQTPFTGYRLEAAKESARSALASLASTRLRTDC